MPAFAALVWKELSQVSRRRLFPLQRTFLAAAASLAFCILAYYAIIPESGGAGHAVGRVLAQYFFPPAAFLLNLLLSLSALMFAAADVPRERARRTLVFLVSAPLSSSTILAGKLAASVLRAVAPFFLVLPVFAVLVITGGIGRQTFALISLLLFSNAVFYASLGLLASISPKARFSPAGRAIVLAVLYNGAVVLLGTLLLSRTGRNILTSLTPFGPVTVLFSPYDAVTVFAMAVAVLLSLAGLIFLLAVYLFDRHAHGLLFPTSPSDGMSPLPRLRRWLRLPRLSSLASRWIPPGVILRELSLLKLDTFFLSAVLLLPVFVFVAFTSGPPSARGFNLDPDVHTNALALEIAAALIVISVLASSRITAEKEARTLQLLGVTSLGPFGIISGKAAAVFLSQLPAVILLLAHSVCIVVISRAPLLVAPFLALLILLCFFNAIMLGLYFSLAADRSSVSAVFVTLAWMTVLFLCIYLPWPGLILLLAAVLVCILLLRVFEVMSRSHALWPLLHYVAFALALVPVAAAVVFALRRGSSVPQGFPAGSPEYSPGFWHRIFRLYLPFGLCLILPQLLLLLWFLRASVIAFDAQLRRSA